MTDQRPSYGNAFEYDRVLNVFFYTSNTTKLLQARLMFMRHGYELKHFKGHREPYDEDYSLGTEQLLTQAIRQVNEEFGLRSIFFVEDTSVRIHSLSSDADFPGLATKEWFQNTSFEDLDQQLTRGGADRRASVTSDIALHVPTLARPVFLQGRTHGNIAKTPPSFEASVQYPWLTPDTFNGWFIPDGTTKRLGEMEFEESLAYDFRAKSIRALLSRLEELHAALNLRPSLYAVRRPNSSAGQLSLLPEQTRVILLIIGDKCAGKTTFSDHMANYESVRVYEASSVLRTIADEEGASVNSANDALAFLKTHGWAAVAEKIANYIEMDDSRWNVVSGLRTPEELLHFRSKFPNAQIVLIDADPRIRFERHIRRSRDQSVRTFEDFLEQDRQQREFGALRVGSDIASISIPNDGSIEHYKKKIDDELNKLTKPSSRPFYQPREGHFGELHRCLLALLRLNGPASCESISAETAAFGARVRVYNTNRALKDVPEFATRIEKPQSRLQYEITERGRHLLTLLDLMRGWPQIKMADWELPLS
jgi:dephospho-CoA kinase/inosine/xanthosine triphosphate pyrophosphatase family protein